MRHKVSPTQRNFLRFSLAGLDNIALAVPLSRVVAVTSQLSVTPVPFTPSSIMGIGKWSGQIITVIDLRVALDPEYKTKKPDLQQSTFLVVTLAGKNQAESVAWRILFDTQIIYLPARLPAQDNPQLSNPACVACQYDQINLLLLDVDRLLLAGQGVGRNIDGLPEYAHFS